MISIKDGPMLGLRNHRADQDGETMNWDSLKWWQASIVFLAIVWEYAKPIFKWEARNSRTN